VLGDAAGLIHRTATERARSKSGSGEAREEFSIVLPARPLSGQPTPSIESSQIRWVLEAELSGYTMDRSMRVRINDFLSRSDSPVIT
jgi:hypothetical protein